MVTRGLQMKRGLYRVWDPLLGEAARVDKSAGDAAPYLSRYLYELLEFGPQFDHLPILPRIPENQLMRHENRAP